MNDTRLQLLLTGEDLDNAEITVCYPGIDHTDTVGAESGTYAFLYLDTRHCAPGTMTINVTKDGEMLSVPYVLNARTMHAEEKESLTPADVVYFLMPDRFAQKPHRHSVTEHPRAFQPSGRSGGTLEGLRMRLPYLADLGVTALWLTPVLENNMPETDTVTSYHGYAVTDYYAVDARFGTKDDYLRLVREAHDKGLKVVMDFIFNHCGAAHPWLNDPPMTDWFNHREWLDGCDVRGGHLPKTNERYLQTNYRLTPTVDPYAADVDKRQTVEGWFVKTMPDLNLRNTHLLQYLTQMTLWWIETAGIDAIRMDTFPYTDKDGMQQWLRRLHAEYPRFKVVGETWVTDSAFSAKWQEGELDSSMDFALFEAFNKAKEEDSDEWWSGMNRIYHVLCYDYLYKNPAMTLAFLDNHDVNRYLGDYDTYDTARQKLLTASMKCALALLLTMPRLPQLYYGTEVMMYGTTGISDGFVRRNFPGGFQGDTNNAFTAAGRTPEQAAMHRWLRRVLRWRRGSKAVAEGTTTQFIPYNGIYVIARRHGHDTVMTIVNGGSHAAMFDPARYKEVTGTAREGVDITTGRTLLLTKPVRMTPRKVVILEIKDNIL